MFVEFELSPFQVRAYLNVRGSIRFIRQTNLPT